MELERIPVELLREIFVRLRDDALSNLVPVALVSQFFYRIVMPLIYRSIKIDISNFYSYRPQKTVVKPRDTLVVRLSAGSSVLTMVRNVHLFSRAKIHPETLAILEDMIPKLSRLESFSWDVDSIIPSILLKIIGRNWPKVQLHMRTGIPKSNIGKTWEALTQAPSMLRSLQVCMPDPVSRNGQTQGRAAKEKLFWVLGKCPGLQSLAIYAHDGNRYRNSHGPPGPWYDLKLESAFPRLSELSIADRTFKADDLLTWGVRGGWTKLKKITLWDDQLLDAFHGCEQSLRSIHLINVKQGYETALINLCSRTTRLIELKIQTENSLLPVSTLEICGSSLRTLAVHTSRSARGNWGIMQDVPLEFLQAIQRFCPELSSLAVNLDWPSFKPHVISALGQISQLTEITLHISRPGIWEEKHESLVLAVENSLRDMIEQGDAKQNLKCLTVRDGADPNDWDNPWGVTDHPSRVVQATRTINAGKTEQKIIAKQIHGPAEPAFKQLERQQALDIKEKKMREYLDAMPPAVLSKMIKVNSRQARGTESSVKKHDYEIQAGGWDPKVTEYEEKWKGSSGILPMLEWQLQKRKEQGWKLWDMPLMESDAGSEGFLYDRMMEASAEHSALQS